MPPIQHCRSGNVFNVIARLETTQQPLVITQLRQVWLKSANLKKPLDTNSATRYVPPTSGFQRPEDRFTRAADDLQLSTKIIFTRFYSFCSGVPTIIAGTNARNGRLCGLDPLQI